MINNRQNGRRRGRGGPQVRNGSGNSPERGNRIDNRARGNAAQLHEKYRNLARDAQTQGDRVMTEYYLQFADHYFRVLSEGRARFEEQNPNQARRPFPQNDDFDDHGFDGDGNDDGMEGDVQQRDPRAFDREPRRQIAYDDGETQQRDVQDGRDGQRNNGQRDNGQRDNGQRDNGQRANRDTGRDSGQGNGQANGAAPGNNRASTTDRDEQRPPRPPREPYSPRETSHRESAQRENAPRESAPRAAEPMVSSPFVEGVEGEPVRARRGRPPRRVEAAAASNEAQPTQIEVDRLPPAFSAPEPAVAQSDVAAAGRSRRRTLGKPDAGEAQAIGAAEPAPLLEPVAGEPANPAEAAAPRRRRVRRDAPDGSNVAA